MQEHLPHNISEEKLAKFFAGEASPEESEEIRLWANQSAENQDLLLQLQVVWIDTGSVAFKEKAPAGKYDINKAWEHVKAKKHAVATGRNSAAWVWRVAAGIIVFIGIGLLLTFYLSSQEHLTYTADSSVDTLMLVDGSSVVLNQNSSLIYPEAFKKDKRVVKLVGEAFFEIAHDPEQPFVVQAGPASIRVLGTSFNVKINSGKVTVSVKTGSVLFSSSTEEVILTGGQQGILSVDTHQLTRRDQSASSGVDQFWRTRTLRFAGHKLPEVVSALEKTYHRKLRLHGKNLSNCSLSVTFKDDSLENILDVIALTFNLKIAEVGDEIILSGEGCVEE